LLQPLFLHISEMNYKQVVIPTADIAVQEILIALLTEIGYEGFEEQQDQLLAFIPETDFDQQALADTLSGFALTFSVSAIEKTNWNKEWEQNFQPVIVDNFCTIRADFHILQVATEHEIVINPKMSFGTGHHATTQLMIRMMRTLDVKDRTVFDFGTGTGILAVLADRLGAGVVYAIDNEEWAFENANENAALNGALNVSVHLGSIEDVAIPPSDIILANINRHILLQYMGALYQKLNRQGVIIMSGLLISDREVIVTAASEAGFILAQQMEHNGWIALRFSK